MREYAPEYFYDFSCIADACPDSCCKEWEVDVDSSSAAFYRSLPGPLGDDLRSVLRDTEDGTVMTITNGRCPMWREDGLCRIQAQLGHGALCRVCQEFPRLCHEYEGFTELGLELSCPEAARLILSAPIQALPSPVENDDPELSLLLKSRSQIIRYLQDETTPPPHQLAVLLLYAHNVQDALDFGDAPVLDPIDCMEDAKRFAGPGDAQVLLDLFRGLEILTPQWAQRLNTQLCPVRWSGVLRHLAVYLINRYWLQAINDLDILCRAKFVIAVCLLVGHLGGDPVQTAQQFSKEVENNDDNVEAILDGCYTSPALTDANLLGLLLE